MQPKRIQRKRIRGWRMPAGAIYVGRPTRWGNPFNPKDFTSLEECLKLYRGYVMRAPTLRARAKLMLRGKDLACWCSLVDKDGNPVPCHADILLEIANGHPEPDAGETKSE